MELFLSRNTKCRERFIAWVHTIRRESTGENCVSRNKNEGAYRCGTEEKSLLSDPGSELRLGKQGEERKKKCEDNSKN